MLSCEVGFQAMKNKHAMGRVVKSREIQMGGRRKEGGPAAMERNAVTDCNIVDDNLIQIAKIAGRRLATGDGRSSNVCLQPEHGGYG